MPRPAPGCSRHPAEASSPGWTTRRSSSGSRRLIDEEHELRESDAEEHRDRIAQLEVSLDQCWDLLRQRRARRHAHLDPDEVNVRDEDVVEGYQQ